MFHFRAVPFPCPYQPDFRCPVSVVLSERDPDHVCVAEAIPCHRCPHFLAQAHTLFARRRVQLGAVGRQILTLAHAHGDQCYPLTAVLRTDLPQRVDLRRVHKAVQALVALRAVRTLCLPAVLPRADHPQHLVLRETLWVQVTTVGDILNSVPAGHQGGRWRHDQAALATDFRTRQAHLATLDLCALYVEQIVALMTAVTQQLVAASDPVMIKRCTASDSPYVTVFVHLEAIAPDACLQLQQIYLRAQDARQRAIAFCQAAVREQREGHNSPTEQ
jgi:hypothetical protein